MTRPTAVRRTLAALATTPLLLAGLAACGDDSGASAAEDPTSSAAAPSLEPGQDVEPADFTDRIRDGFEQLTTAHATFDAELDGGSMTGEGDVDYRADKPAVAMAVDSDTLVGSGIEIRLVDGVMYVNLGEVTQDKFWRLDLDAPDNPFGTLGSQLDLKGSVELLEKGLESVTYAGEEDGLDHYEVTVDPQALVEQLGPAGVAGAPSLPDSIEYDLWLDDQSRVNRLSYEMGELASVEMTLSDFGADVTVKAPSPGEIADMPKYFGDLGSDPGDAA